MINLPFTSSNHADVSYECECQLISKICTTWRSNIPCQWESRDLIQCNQFIFTEQTTISNNRIQNSKIQKKFWLIFFQNLFFPGLLGRDSRYAQRARARPTTLLHWESKKLKLVNFFSQQNLEFGRADHFIYTILEY